VRLVSERHGRKEQEHSCHFGVHWKHLDVGIDVGVCAGASVGYDSRFAARLGVRGSGCVVG
jgi:hypothetical protein